MSLLVSVENVSLSYPTTIASLAKREDKLALSEINLKLKGGDRLALVGLNGSGKSTLLRTIAGIYKPQQGSVSVNGTVSALFNLGIGMRMDLTGRKNIILQGMVNGQTRDEIDALLPEIIAFSELEHVIDDPIHTYSQGMAMRLSFSIATAIKPDVLLLDEWIGAGDRVFREKANTRLLEMVQDSGGLVLASHNTTIVRKYCNKAIWLNEGKISASGDVENVLAAFIEGTTRPI